MSQQWSDFPVSHEPSSLPDTVEGGHYVRVAMTSHDLMTVWAAGPARAFRVAVPISARPPGQGHSHKPADWPARESLRGVHRRRSKNDR